MAGCRIYSVRHLRDEVSSPLWIAVAPGLVVTCLGSWVANHVQVCLSNSCSLELESSKQSERMSFCDSTAVDLAVIVTWGWKGYQLVKLFTQVKIVPQSKAGWVFGQVQKCWQTSQCAHRVDSISTHQVQVAAFHLRHCFLQDNWPQRLKLVAVKCKP